MNIPTKLAHQFAKSIYVNSLSLIVSFISFLWVMRDYFVGAEQKIIAVAIMLGAVLLFVTVNLYSIKIHRDNENLKGTANHFREINSNYREVLYANFWNKTQTLKIDERLLAEKSALKAVCQSIAKLFSRMIRKECTVTVKLLTIEEDGISYATTYVRNQERSERDINDIGKYRIGTGYNSGFDQVLQNPPLGQLSYFHSADLTKEENYANQRPHYLNWYTSVIIVPIRCPFIDGVRKAENYGFLTVDTMSRHRLDNDHHVVILSALAEQMFNFMALMRGHYKISAEKNQ